MIALGIILLVVGLAFTLGGFVIIVDEADPAGMVAVVVGIVLITFGIITFNTTYEDIPEIHKAYIVSSHAKPDTLGVITSESPINIEILRNDWRVEQ